MGPKSKYRSEISRHKKKRKSPGRKKKAPPPTTIDEQEQQSSSAKKLKIDTKRITTTQAQIIMSWCYLMIDSRILKDIIDTIGTCPKCSSKVCFDHNVDDRRGLSHLLKLSCSNCKCK